MSLVRVGTQVDLVEEAVELGDRVLTIARPADSEALLDEDAFEREEFLPYWAELWPSGVELARALTRRDLRGIRVLELGCGLALPSLAAASRGARVLATDWSPDAVALVEANAERNGVRLETALVDWARPEPLLDRAPWDLVVAADVLYERRNAAALLALLPRLVEATGEGVVAEPGRPAAATFFAEAAAAWTVESTRASDSPRVDLHVVRPRR